MSKRDGPKITVRASCFDCAHETSESERVQGDSGCNVYCTFGGGRRVVGWSTWNTPAWCPLLAHALAEKARETLTAAGPQPEEGRHG